MNPDDNNNEENLIPELLLYEGDGDDSSDIEAQEDSVSQPGNSASTPLLRVTKAVKKTNKLPKESVMPTWAATQHILEKQKKPEIVKTNCEVVAPLFRNSPHDYATLWTVLSLTQEINAQVLGNGKCLITLDIAILNDAYKLRSSVRNNNWVLCPGKLHEIFADEHALGKVAEGSGLDTIAIESGVYSAAALRGIYGGKNYTRGLEHHIMNAIVIICCKLEAVYGSEYPAALKAQTERFRKALHNEQPEASEIYEDLSTYYSENIKEQFPPCDQGLPKFLNNYLIQVETVLASIAAVHSRDFEAGLTLLDKKVKYYGAEDLPNYFTAIQIYLDEMCKLKREDPATWERLKKDPVVSKSTEAFVNLFIDQALEQEIKEIIEPSGCHK